MFDKNMKKILLGSLIFGIIGFLGFLSPYGDEKWNFIFENLIWIPIEVIVLGIVVTKLLTNSEEVQNKKIQDKRYKKLAGKSQKECMKTIYFQLIDLMTGMHTIENYSEVYKKEYSKINELFTSEKLKHGYDKLYAGENVINDFMDGNLKFINVSHYHVSGQVGFHIKNKIEIFIERYKNYIPDEIALEFFEILYLIDSSILFSTNENLVFSREQIIKLYYEKSIPEEEIKKMANYYIDFFNNINSKIEQLERLTENIELD
ncbi:hypothetical protein OL233_11000 [Vagococcus sp. PNs007]|uniref:Phage abortive infection protein n=1 Tax=Vagococcus proximus TaxID=2991417 RepID=A0ABT5X4J6_9ENTE|nr:hypothetical protein [Vagococcus proximus]MDF0480806.1 hypothetical protein [Vagococcus proximus]